MTDTSQTLGQRLKGPAKLIKAAASIAIGILAFDKSYEGITYLQKLPVAQVKTQELFEETHTAEINKSRKEFNDVIEKSLEKHDGMMTEAKVVSMGETGVISVKKPSTRLTNLLMETKYAQKEANGSVIHPNNAQVLDDLGRQYLKSYPQTISEVKLPLRTEKNVAGAAAILGLFSGVAGFMLLGKAGRKFSDWRASGKTPKADSMTLAADGE